MPMINGTELMQEVFIDTTVFSIDWFIVLAITFISLIIISRNTEHWKVMALPMTIGWHVAGLSPSFLQYIATGIMFIISSLSLQTLGNIVGAIKNVVQKDPTEAKLRQKVAESIFKAKTKRGEITSLKGVRDSIKNAKKIGKGKEFRQKRMKKKNTISHTQFKTSKEKDEEIAEWKRIYGRKKENFKRMNRDL